MCFGGNGITDGRKVVYVRDLTMLERGFGCTWRGWIF
jgi:hypothetical protein